MAGRFVGGGLQAADPAPVRAKLHFELSGNEVPPD